MQGPHPLTASCRLILALFVLPACTNSKSKQDGESRSDTAPFDTATDTASPGHAATIGPTVPCPEPLPEPRWEEVSQARGLPNRPDDGRQTREATYLAVHDFDDDGDLDIFLIPAGGDPGGADERPVLMRQEDSGFEAETYSDLDSLWQPTLGDVDGDGDLDLLAGGSSVWLRDDGATLTTRPFQESDPSGAAFARELEGHDINADGFLDLYVLRSHPEALQSQNRDYILWGDGTGNFSKDEDSLPTSKSSGNGFDAQWIDWESDGQPEIYVANDRGAEFGPNRLWRPQSGTWKDEAPMRTADLAHSAMGVDASDLNRDGLPDLYLTASGANVLLVSQPDGSMVDMTLALNANPLETPGSYPEMGWGGIWVDFDNDGGQDILHTPGDWWSEPEGPRPEDSLNLLRWNGEQFEEAAPESGLVATGSFRGVVAQDFNSDGIQDFVISSVFGRPLLYLSEGCTQNNWLQVYAPAGSVVTVNAGGETQRDWLSTSSGYGATTTPVAHFGLGEIAQIESIDIMLPGGELRTITGPLDARRTIKVAR